MAQFSFATVPFFWAFKVSLCPRPSYLVAAPFGTPSTLRLPWSAAFLVHFQRFFGSFSHEPPDSLQSAEMFFHGIFNYLLTSLHPESWTNWIKTGHHSAMCKNAVLCHFRSLSPTIPWMRSSPLHFYLADILYFIFYSISPNLGHFGPQPVGLMLPASMQFYVVVHPQFSPPIQCPAFENLSYLQ